MVSKILSMVLYTWTNISISNLQFFNTLLSLKTFKGNVKHILFQQFSLPRVCPINHLSVPFYSHQNVGLMGLSLIIQSSLNCDPETREQLICTRHVESRHIYLPYKTRGIKWRRAELSWLDLNNQTSVEWRRAELADLTWAIKSMLIEDVLSWADLTWLEQSNQC